MVDLGSWPGSWLQVVVERIGPAGRVVGVDVARVTPVDAPNVRVLAGDIREAATVAAIRADLGRPADVLLSDLAPKLTGVGATDEARWDELAAATLGAVSELLRPDGRVVLKLFMGPGHAALVRDLRRSFAAVSLTRPEATRQGSSELYAVGRGYRGRQPSGASE